MKFRKKPIVIEAIQVMNTPTVELEQFMGQTLNYIGGKGYAIPTLEGVMYASYGDWIIRGVNGEYYPCKPDIFEKTYERVEE